MGRVQDRQARPRRSIEDDSAFPVDPADVPETAVRAVKRTLLRHAGDDLVEDPFDDDLARLIVAVVYADLYGRHPSMRGGRRRTVPAAASRNVVALF